MTAVESRLAATLAKHQRFGRAFRCNCGWEWPETPTWACGEEDRFECDLAAHQAAVIASSDDLAVIELPTPEGDYWQAGPFEVTTSVGGEVIVDHEYWLSPSDATAGCAGILAAAKAAEEVSDRG